VLCKTTANQIAESLTEKKAVKWAGRQITLYPTQCEAFGKTVDCIRVRIG
jgi:phage-related protein